MTQRKPFTMIDFYESLSTIDLVKVDFDNSYPHHTENLLTWLRQWLPTLLDNEAQDIQHFYQAVPTPSERGLLVSGPGRSHIIYIPYLLDRPEVLLGVSTLINLSQCQTFRAVINVLNHIRKDEWTIEYPPVDYDEFVALRLEFNTYLREKFL